MKDHIKKYIPSSSRRKARSISPEKLRLMEEFYPSIKIDLSNLEELIKKIKSFKFCNLEIGFGGGEHLIHQAKNNPDTLFIGSEVFYNGLCACIFKIHNERLKNILIFDGDVRLLLEEMNLRKDSSVHQFSNSQVLNKIYILFPDPWPKNQHKKKRLINKQTLDLIFPLMKKGGVIRIATDHNVYFEHVLQVMEKDERFKNIPMNCHSRESGNPDSSIPTDHIITKYQQKALEAGRVSRFLEYICL